MGRPYLNLYKTMEDGTKVYLVDGAYVRKHLNEEFTNFANHYNFPNLIVKGEYWIDKGHGKDEYKYFIAHMQKEDELMQNGSDWDKAYAEACRYESDLRKKENNEPIKKEKIGEQDRISIWLVNGEQVRNKYDIDFVQGGHDKVYPYIPKNEIWIDDYIPEKERDEVILHELWERDQMSQGKEYEPAHEGASMVEKKYRKKGKKSLSTKAKEIFSSLSSMRR